MEREVEERKKQTRGGKWRRPRAGGEGAADRPVGARCAFGSRAQLRAVTLSLFGRSASFVCQRLLLGRFGQCTATRDSHKAPPTLAPLARSPTRALLLRPALSAAAIEPLPASTSMAVPRYIAAYDPRAVLDSPDFRILPKGEVPRRDPSKNLAVAYAPEAQLHLVEKSVPKPREGEVVLHVRATGICGRCVSRNSFCPCRHSLRSFRSTVIVTSGSTGASATRWSCATPVVQVTSVR